MASSSLRAGRAGHRLRQRTPVSGRARARPLPPGLERLALLRERLSGEGFRTLFDHARPGHHHH